MSAAAATRYPFTSRPNGWFRAGYSQELSAGEIVVLRFFGRDWLLYRSESGEARVSDPHCPHLGAHIGHGGQVVGEHIRCPFHHWEWDRDGHCAAVPYAKRRPARARLAMYPVLERDGIIFFHHDREGARPEFELPEIPEMSEPGWTPLEILRWTVRAHWLDMNENTVDAAHFRFIHGTESIPKTTVTQEGPLLISESLFEMRTSGGNVESQLVTYDHGPGLQLVRIQGLIDTLMINTCTPIDDEYTDVSFAYTVRAEGDPSKLRLAAAVVEDLKQQFEHDRPIWENKAHWERPVLCEGDGPIARYRRWYSQFV